MKIEMLHDINYVFTADTHFDDAAIIELENRPFANIEEQRETLIANWNAVIRPKDIVWHLGDFAYALDNRATNINSILDRLNGSINIVLGNHDNNNLVAKTKKRFSSVSDYKEISIDYLLDGKQKRQYINLFHYPIRGSWRGAYKGAWHLYGHCHGKTPPYGKSFDIGLMNHGWKPLTFAEVHAKMATRPFKYEAIDIAD